MVHTSKISSEKVSVEPVQMIFKFAMIKFAVVKFAVSDKDGVQAVQVRQFFSFSWRIFRKKKRKKKYR